VLATGGIARVFATDLKRLPDARVVAVGSRTASAASDFAAEFGVGRAHGSWHALAEDPEIDIVYIATPHSFHHAAAAACLRAGKPVLAEKPLTLDVVQAQDLITRARERGLLLMEAMWMLTLPAMLRMRRLVADGAIGTVADGAIGTVAAVHASFGLQQSFAAGHRLRNPCLGGGALLDLGVYAVHFAQSILGAPQQIRALARLHPEKTDARTGMVLSFADGAIATLYCGVEGLTGFASVIGTLGRIDFPEGFYNATRFVLHRHGRPPETVECGPAGLHFQAAEAARCLRAGLTESPLVPHEATLAAMRTMDAVRAQIGVAY
jgi:predicted dehydrogenase